MRETRIPEWTSQAGSDANQQYRPDDPPAGESVQRPLLREKIATPAHSREDRLDGVQDDGEVPELDCGFRALGEEGSRDGGVGCFDDSLLEDCPGEEGAIDPAHADNEG